MYSLAAISCSIICCRGVPGGKLMAGAAGATPGAAPAMAGAEAAWCMVAAELLEVAGRGTVAAGEGAATPGSGDGPRDAVLARLLAAAAFPLGVFTETWSVSCLQEEWEQRITLGQQQQRWRQGAAGLRKASASRTPNPMRWRSRPAIDNWCGLSHRTRRA